MDSCSALDSAKSEPPPKRIKLSYSSIGEQIEGMKVEVKMKIKSFRDLIDIKECELLDELDKLAALQESEGKEMVERIEDLTEQALFKSTHNKLGEVGELIESAVEDVSIKLEQFQQIHFPWKTEELESNTTSLCSPSNVDGIYQSISPAKWNILVGDKPTQLSSPTSLAIQQFTDNVFVSDRNGNRIQVYSSLGEHIRMIDRFNGPLNVFYVNDTFIVAISSPPNPFLELNMETLETRTIRFPYSGPVERIACYTTPKQYVFLFPRNRKANVEMCEFQCRKPIMEYRVTNKVVSTMYSIASEISPVSRAKDITSNGTKLYILVSNSDNLIYEYDNQNFEFIRSFCPSSLLCGAKYVCVDRRGNILVAGTGSEGHSTKLLCLSPDGDVIQELLTPYQNCIGIAVNSKFDISLLCNGDMHGLVTL